MRLAVSYVPAHPDAALRFAALAARTGIDFVGIADTPHLRGGAFPALQHALAGTDAIPIGTFVTNPVLRHPSVLAADFEALTRLYPGRVVAGIGAGDSAVRSVGLRPARPQDLAEAVRVIRQRAGDGVRLLVAASSVSTARTIPPEADGIVIGGGLDPQWLTTVIAAAEVSAGHRLERFGFVVGTGFGSPALEGVDAGRLVTSVMTISRHALSRRPLERGVPAALAAGLVDLYAHYDVHAYGDPVGANASLLRDRPEIRDYLMQRFSLLGDVDGIANRLREVERSCGLDGIVATTGAADPLDLAERIATTLGPRLR